MATEESSSTSAASNSPSVDSYLGSIISLTSKSEIRYEGVLVSIDPKESTISLQNVKSYGTEGRKKEGPQVPPSEKVYEFILFRGTDIKDLQVKSAPSVPSKQHISDDPAIIQSQYAHTPTITLATSVGAVAHADPGQQYSGPSQPFPGGPGHQYSGPGQQFPGSGPVLGQHSQLYQAGSRHGSGVSPPLANVNVSMLPQGYTGASSNQASIPQAISYNPQLANSQYSSQSQNLPESSNYPVFPSQTSHNYNNMSALLPRNTPLASSVHSHIQTMPTFSAFNQKHDSINFSSSMTGLPDAPSLHGSSVPSPSLAVTSINMPPVLRSEQLTNVIPPAVTSYVQQQYPDSRNAGVLLPPSMNTQLTSGMPQEPLLPLPVQAERGTAQQFNDEFDFTAMNEKFNKDEVWGSLGKKNQDYRSENPSNYNAEASDGSLQNPINTGNKPVYKKDDFFDTISCNRGGWNGQNRMHERRRLDTETFGEYQERPPMGRGNYGGSYSGYYRGGSYNNRGRGYGYYGGRGTHGGYRPNY